MRKLKLFLTLLMLMCIGVTQMWADPISATLNSGTNCTSVTINSGSAIKVGTSKADGDMTITVGEGATKLSFYASAWKGNNPGNISVSAPSGVTVSPATISLTANDNVTGSFTNITVSPEATYLCEVTLSGVTSETAITLASGTERRFAVWKATYETGGSTPPANPYTVSFSTGTGNGAVAALTEDPAGAGITLPAGPTSIACEGWSFAGWAEAAVASETTTAPTLLAVGANYKPTDNVTLYAVYSRTESTGGTSGAAVNTVMLSENWTGISADDKPASPTEGGSSVYGSASIEYTYKDGGTKTKGYTTGGPNDNENLLVSKTNGNLTISGIPTGSAATLSVTYATSGSGSIAVSTTTENVTYADGTITIGNSGVTSFNLIFTNSAGSNVRLDDIVVKVATTSAGGSTTYYISEPDCSTPTPTPTCENTVSVTKVTPVNGDFDISATEVCGDGDGGEVTISNIEPATGYTLDEVSVTVGTYNESTGKVTGITANTEITVTFKELPKYTVSFETGAGNPEQAAITEESYGAGITLPAGPTPKCKDDGWAFAGWAKAAVAEQTTTAPTLLSGTYNPEANNETLYAVYRRSEESGNLVWAKMTSNPQVGDAVLLVNEDAKVEAKDKTQAKYITTQAYETTPAGLLPWTVEAGDSEGTFSFKNGDDYLKLDKSSNELHLSTTKNEYSSWTVSVANDGTATITNSNSSLNNRVIKYNSGSPRFACYTSGQQAIQLYKQTPGSTIYYLSAPTCCEKHAISIASGIENGSVSADLASACEGTIVTLTFTPAGSHHLDSWSVNGIAQDVNVNTFSMPAEAATVSAKFEHDACKNLEQPALEGEIAKTYHSATIVWGEVEHASSYLVSVIKNGAEEPIFSGSVTELSKELSDLEAETQYNYTIMAVGDGVNYCAEGNLALEGNFTTAALPEVKLTLMVGDAEDDRSANYPILTAFELPSTASVDNCPKVFVGWSADADRTTAPEYAPGAEFTFADETPATLYAVFATPAAGAPVTYPIDFEADAATYTNWTFTNMVSNHTNSGVTAHGGSKIGSTNGKETASITTVAKITTPTSLTAYVSKQTTNTTSSTWYVEVSADGTDWTEAKSLSATSMSKGEWVELSADLSSYSNVYVRVYYEGSSAVRVIDDLVLSAVGPKTYSEYGTACEACKVVTLAKSGEDQEKGNTFELKVGDDVVESVQTCEAASVTIEPTVATGYEASFAISELEGASLSENIISLAANTTGKLTVTANFTLKNHVVTLAQNPAAGATLVGGKEDAHYNETINLSTDVPTGYEFINWTSESVEITNATSATGASFTMPDADVTVTANFGKVYTVSFNAGSDPITETAIGAGVELPAGPALSDACVAAGWVFAGWAEATVIDETTDAPELTAAGANYHPESDIELFAVYKRIEEGGSSIWAKMTSNPQVGDAVLLVNEDAKVEAKDKTQTKYITVEEYETTPAGLLPWTLEAGNSEGTFSFKNGDVYLNLPGASNELRQSAEKTNNSSWTISVANDGTATITNVAYTARVIKFNSGSPRFACYESGQQAIQLYKQTAASTTYYWSAPECCTPHNVTIADNIEHGTVVANPTSACAGATIAVTLTAENGYELQAWTVDGTEQELTATTFTMPNKDVVVSATFSEIVTPPAEATLKLMENGHEVVFAGSHNVDDVVTLPNELSDAAHACYGKILKGWSAVEITTPVAAKPSENFYELGAEYTIATAADVLYAVFAEEVPGVTNTTNIAYAGSTANMTGNNDAATFGLDANQWSVVGAKNNASNNVGLNKVGDIRLYGAANGGSTLTITAPQTITSVELTLTTGYTNAYVEVGGNQVSAVDGVYPINATSFVIGNANTNTTQVRMTNIAVNFTSAGSVANYATSCVAPLADPQFSVEGGEYTEAQTIELSAAEGTIYYTLDGKNPTSASTQYEAPIVLNDCGTTTIKAIAISATNHSEVVSETYTLNIPLPENSELIPYAPAQAIEVFDGNCYNNEMVYVKGVVKTSSGLNTTYGNYDNIVVVAAETTAPEFTFFHMYKGANKAKFDANDPVIAAGDTIVAYGELTKYNAIYEFKDGCYLIDRKAYNVPKQSIVNDLAGAYTLAEAINFLDKAAIYDLSEEVYVKGVATTAPNSYNTFTAHDPEAENVFQFYNTNLNELTVGVNDTIIVKGLIKKVNANYRMEAGVVQQVTAYVAPVVPEFTVNPTAVAFGNVEQNASVDAIELNVELTAIANATVTLTDENNVFSINQATLTENGVVVVSVTNTNVEVGPYVATITIHDAAGVAEDKVVNVTMTIIAGDSRKKAQDLDGFDALNGNLNADIAFASTKGDGTADPKLESGSILYYQPSGSNDAGGYMTLTAVKGCMIDQVKIVTAENNATSIKYSKDGEELSDATSVTAGATYLTPAELNAQMVNIYCAGADKNHRLYVAQVVVYYTGEATPLHHHSVDASAVVTTEFPKNGTFSSEGLVVYACYDANCEDYVDITDQCNVVADLTSIGEKKAEVYLGEEKLGEYDITVVAGQEDPALAYTPASETIPAAGIGGWVAPTLNNPFNVTPSYNTNNAAVATVDESGVIALAGGYGKAVITASFAETEDYIASIATYTITVQEPANKIAGKWMVAGAEDIKPGIKVIVVGEKSGTKYAMGAQNTNNRAAVAAQSIVADTLYAAEGTKTFILVDAGEGLYAFQANNGMYLYAASNSSNQMKEQATLNDNGKWSIAIANDGEATIQAQGSNSRNLMSMTPNGNNNPLFSCYNSKQSAIKLYVNRNQIDGSDDPANPAEVAINDNVVEDEIVANGNVVVTVNTDNIEEPKSYIAQNGATIIITGTNPVAKNVVVEDGSRIEASVPTTTPNVYFATTMGSTQTPGTASELGSVTNITLATGGEIIYDLTLGTSMAGIQADPNQWHAFTLPFAVSATEGIYDAETGAKLYNEVNYAIMDYHGDIRANGLYGWKKYSGILQPGVFYIMTVDGNTKTFRFKATQTGPMTQTTSMGYKAYNGSGDPLKDFGWNGIGNPSWVSGTVTVNVQVLDPYSYTYQPLTSSTNITVSTPFFYNAGGDGSTGSVVMQDAGTGANYAPARTPANEIKNVAVSFGNEVFRDKIYISASEDALNEYEQDKDLVRMIMSNTPKVAQIFGNAYGMKLSMVNAPMANDQAEYSLTLYAPNAGEYTISAPEMEDADIFLTYEGSIIWNLSMSDYTNNFAKGNNEGYGLILVKKAPQVVTGIDNAEANEAGVQKVIINDHVYILRAEQMYDVTGKMVK